MTDGTTLIFNSFVPLLPNMCCQPVSLGKNIRNTGISLFRITDAAVDSNEAREQEVTIKLEDLVPNFSQNEAEYPSPLLDYKNVKSYL